jgi:hypothetical protein
MLAISCFSGAGDLTLTVDALSEKYYYGEMILIGIFVRNNTDISVEFDIIATAQIPEQYLFSSNEVRRRKERNDRFAYFNPSLEPGQAMVYTPEVIHSWRYAADYSKASIVFPVTVTVLSANPQDRGHVLQEQSINIVVERPESRRGLEILQRFLTPEDDTTWGTMTYSRLFEGKGIVPQSEISKDGTSTWVSSEYSEHLAVDALLRTRLKSWLEIPQATADRFEVLRTEIISRRIAFGASPDYHPTECLLVTALGLPAGHDPETVFNSMRACGQGNAYYAALADHLASLWKAELAQAAAEER